MNFQKKIRCLLRFIKPDATDENWKFYGEKSAYFGVVTWPQFRPENMNEKSRADFFKTGEEYIERIVSVIRETIAPEFNPRNALDFGCGVGRLVIPLTKHCVSVTGVDVSPGMLEEAKRNCASQNITSVKFIASMDELIGRTIQFDFVHSFIVFQHIRPKRGYELFKQLIGLLENGGIGTVHFTYCHPSGKRDRLMQWLYRKFPLLWALENFKKGRPVSDPLMDMAEYSLNRLFRILQENGCDVCHTRFSNHGVLGVLIFFKKNRIPAY